MIKKISILFFLAISYLNAYDFILLNTTSIDDDVFSEYIQDQVNNYYYSEDGQVEFNELENKEEILNFFKRYDYPNDEEELKILVSKAEELEDDLNLIFKTKYFLLLSEKTDREGRNEFRVVLKIGNSVYFDEEYLIPLIEDKEELYRDIVASAILAYITYKDKNFINIEQF